MMTTASSMKNGIKAKGLEGQNNNFHCASCFLYTSLPSLHYYNGRMPNFTFCGGHEHKVTTFFFFF